MNALSAQQNQYSLRSRDVPINPIQKRKELLSKNDSSNTQRKGKEPADPSSRKEPLTNNIENEKNNQPSAVKEQVDKKDLPVKEVEKVSSFNLENEIAKAKGVHSLS